jgi:hypothetical protein
MSSIPVIQIIEIRVALISRIGFFNAAIAAQSSKLTIKNGKMYSLLPIAANW